MTAAMSHNQPDFQELLAQYCDGQLTDAQQLAWFAEQLRGSADRRQEFYNYHDLHAELYWLESASARAVLELPPAEKPLAELPAASWWRRSWETINTIESVALIIATLTMAIIVLSLALWMVPDWRPGMAGPDADRPVFVARVVRTYQAAWSETSEVPANQVTDLLQGHPLELTGGMAEVEFDSGAKVTMVAPCTFVPRGKGRMELIGGSLTVHVPQAAVGFTVDTPVATFIDLGTEFVADVAQDGTASLGVAEGSVQIATGKQTIVLRAGQSASVPAVGLVKVDSAISPALLSIRRQVAAPFAPPATFGIIPIPTGAGDEAIVVEGVFVGAVNCGPDSPAVEVGGLRFAGSVEAADGINGIRILSTAQTPADGQSGTLWQAELAKLFEHLDGSAYGGSFDLTISGLTPGDRYRAQFISGQGLLAGQERIRDFRISLGQRTSEVVAAAATSRTDAPGAKSVVAEFTARQETVVFQLAPVDSRSRAVLAAVALFRLE